MVSHMVEKGNLLEKKWGVWLKMKTTITIKEEHNDLAGYGSK